ncbi:type I methionyl aminopeptidase [Hydromonas duriensis]|uniref:Methionine aminopeptidase n=1 Tax=Hydromonas duriensis TaxID=1527608 RepID=A0A4R6Y5I6_9BURK|nr:type I methionyl aminopeptidase [Hydromonas duriensis]TDR30505.1 methionine aminopeptidase type I [Hydromonas duriensis]
MTVTIKDDNDIAHMRIACRLASELLDYLTPHVVAGITTGEIDRLAHNYMVDVQKTIPATLGYQPPGYPPYPKSCCISVNDVICHGVPSDDKVLKNGDIANIDVTVITPAGYFGDTSRMFIVGEGSIAAKRLCEVTYESMWHGIAQVKEGATLGDIGAAIAAHAHKNGMSVVREYCGHGIGKVFHEDPQVLHYGIKGQGMTLKAGMIFTIEPMINAGKRDMRTMPDGWTVKTKDRSLSAQWEHTVLVTPTGYEVLTLSEGSPAAPSFIQTSAH